MKTKYSESTICANFVTDIVTKTNGTVEVTEKHVYDYIAKAVVRAIASYAHQVSNKEKPAAVVISDFKGNMLLAGIIKYIPGEDASDGGNYSYSMSFNKNDIEGCTVYKMEDTVGLQQFASAATVTGFSFNDAANIVICLVEFCKTLRDWLDDNAKADEKVEVELENFFTASVVVEDDEKIFSIDPSGMIKEIAKNDVVMQTN